MKLITAALSFFAATTVFGACPDLSGTFICKSGDAESEVTISQAETDGQTVYTLEENGESSNYPSDNVEYPFSYEDKDNGIVGEGTVRFVCEDVYYNIYVKGEEKKKDVTTTWDYLQSFSLDADTNLSITVKGSYTENDVKTDIDDAQTCTRKAAEVKTL